MRRESFQNDEFYHVYNRGNDKRDVFLDDYDYVRFLKGMRGFNHLEPIESLYKLSQDKNKERAEVAKLLSSSLATQDQLVDIVCYCLNSNHFHLLLRQITKQGISKYMHKLGYGYSRYFNNRYNRSGSLFEGTYKAIQIKTEGRLNQISCYINANSEIHKIAKAENYKWCSYQDYLGKRNGTLVNKNIILKDFKNIEEYRELTNYVIQDEINLKNEIKKYSLE